MAAATWTGRVSDHLPFIGRLRRERDSARRQAQRFAEILAEVVRRDGIVIVERDGLNLLLDPKSMVDKHMLTGTWEQGTLAMMSAATRALAGDPRRKLFLDIGAHWGLYALRMWKLGVFDEIHCFEPEPHNRAQLAAQLFLNHAAYDIRVHPVAVLDQAGAVFIQRATATPDNRGSAALTSRGKGVPAEAVAIDETVPASGAIVFVKIDAEGSEPRILDGMRKLLADNEVYLQIEVMPGTEPEIVKRIPARLRPVARDQWEWTYATFDWPRVS